MDTITDTRARIAVSPVPAQAIPLLPRTSGTIVMIGNSQENNRVARCGRIGKSPNPCEEETRLQGHVVWARDDVSRLGLLGRQARRYTNRHDEGVCFGLD